MRLRHSHRGTQLPLAATTRLARDGEVPFIRYVPLVQVLRTSNRVRIFSAGVSLLVLAASLFMLYKPRISQLGQSASPISVPVWLLERPKPIDPEVPSPRASSRNYRAFKGTPARKTAEPSAPSLTLPVTRVITPNENVAPSAVAGSAAAPLHLGANVIRAAVAGSKGSVRRLAESSGQLLDTPSPTKEEVFAAAVGSAGIPDCLRPDALKQDTSHIGAIGFGGILAVPFLAHAAITGKCKP